MTLPIILYVPDKLLDITSLIVLIYSKSVHDVVKKALTFSRIKNLGLISITNLTDCVTKDFSVIHLSFMIRNRHSLARGVAIITSTSPICSFFFQLSISANILS